MLYVNSKNLVSNVSFQYLLNYLHYEIFGDIFFTFDPVNPKTKTIVNEVFY